LAQVSESNQSAPFATVAFAKSRALPAAEVGEQLALTTEEKSTIPAKAKKKKRMRAKEEDMASKKWTSEQKLGLEGIERATRKSKAGTKRTNQRSKANGAQKS